VRFESLANWSPKIGDEETTIQQLERGKFVSCDFIIFGIILI
jgi:hypothetical protein